MDKTQCAALDDLVALTQSYVDAIKRLSNLSTIDTSTLESDTQSRWLWRVDNEITVAVRAVVKLGGPNDTMLMLPCQRPELRGLYVKHELLKAGISGFTYKPDNSDLGIEKATTPDPEVHIAAEAPASKASKGVLSTEKPRKHQKRKARETNPGVVVDEGTKDPRQSNAQNSTQQAHREDVKHEEANETIENSQPLPTPRVPDTLLPQGNNLVFLRQTQILCEALRDLEDDKDRLSEQIEHVKDSKRTAGESELEGTLAELEYQFKLYSANCHPLGVAIADVTSRTARDESTPSHIAERLFELKARAENLFTQNTLLGDTLGMKRDLRSFLSHSRGPLVLAK